MYLNNIQYLIPEIILSLSIVILLIYGVIYGKINGLVSHLKNTIKLSILILILVGWLINLININNNENIIISDNLLFINKWNIIIKLIIIFTGIIVLLLLLNNVEKKDEKLIDNEITQLILISILGMLLLVSSKDLIMIYLSIETISLSLYILATIRRTGQYSTEAGLKYFILGALSSGILLFGSSIIYITTGLTDIISIQKYIELNNNNIGIELGLILIIIALLFKLAAAPFHMWAPDVYEGSPTIITAYFAIVPKIAILSLLISIIYGSLLIKLSQENIIQNILLISGILSIIIGSIAAINQTKIKRLLAYSAIAHMGWMILGISMSTIMSLQATMIYIILYIIMSINTFSLILYIYKGYGNNYIIQLSGISRNEPIIAITLSLGLLSIAGIPPLAGFYSKYYILSSMLEQNYIILTTIAIIFSVIGTYYYIRIIQWLYFNGDKSFIWKELGEIIIKGNYNIKEIEENTIIKKNKIDLIKALIIGSTLYIIISYLIYPNPIIILTYEMINSLII